MFSEKVVVRFWEKVAIRGANECWEWTSAMYPSGYGAFFLNGHTSYAHRVSFELHNGSISDGLCVCHSCDNRKCVNPNHLFLGTQSDNARDMVSKNRHGYRTHPESYPKGERHPNAKITLAQIEQMKALRKSGMFFYEIASRFGVDKSYVYYVVNGKRR